MSGENALLRGLVIINTGSWYTVKLESGEEIECKIKGKFRLEGIRSTNPIAVGDNVTISRNQDDTPFIESIEERKNYIVRRASNLSKQSHILAANLDQAFLVITLTHPTTHTIFIDRFLATCEAYNVPAILIFNKIDLHTPSEDELLKAMIHLYSSIGYPCIAVSGKTGIGIDQITNLMKEKITLLAGNSGVGKSTLINALAPHVQLKTGEVSHAHNKGMHTTTFSTMINLPQGGYLIDTPGVKGFGTIDFDTQEVAHYFPEIFKISHQCRFNNCTHRHEPGCAVLEALEKHQISQSRYAGFLSIIDDHTESKYRQ